MRQSRGTPSRTKGITIRVAKKSRWKSSEHVILTGKRRRKSGSFMMVEAKGFPGTRAAKRLYSGVSKYALGKSLDVGNPVEMEGPEIVIPSGSDPGSHQKFYGSFVVRRFIDNAGLVVVEDVADWFGMSKAQFAQTVGVRPETLQRVQRATAAKTQNRVKEMLEIVGRVAEWAGGKDQALAWYRAEPIPAFGSRTAESLVKEGKATAVRDYLDHIALGGFA